MTVRNTNHVCMIDGIFTCLHCGARYTMNVPCPMNVFTAAMGAFVNDHAECRAPLEPTIGQQLDLLRMNP